MTRQHCVAVVGQTPTRMMKTTMATKKVWDGWRKQVRNTIHVRNIYLLPPTPPEFNVDHVGTRMQRENDHDVQHWNRGCKGVSCRWSQCKLVCLVLRTCFFHQYSRSMCVCYLMSTSGSVTWTLTPHWGIVEQSPNSLVHVLCDTSLCLLICLPSHTAPTCWSIVGRIQTCIGMILNMSSEP